MAKIRKLVSNYLVYGNHKPVILTPDKAKADALSEMIRKKGKESHIKQITGQEGRLEEIGENIFKKTKALTEQQIKSILKIRNKVIIEWLDYKKEKDVSDEVAWTSVAKKNGFNNFKEMEEFSQWALDVAEYYGSERN